MNRRLFITACLVLASAVITGAFGAHFLRARLDVNGIEAWKTAVQYHFYHGLGMLLFSFVGNNFFHAKRMNIAGWLLFCGILLFSGSLYLLATKQISGLEWGWLGPLTPIGGLLFLTGWVMAGLGLKRQKVEG